LISPEEFLYYSRQTALQDVGIQGQKKLKSARVVCIGAGGLGCPALQYLAAMGVGNILIVDEDTVDFSNIHRQVLYTVHDIGQKKAVVAQKKLRSINPNILVETKTVMLSAENAESILSDATIVLDCSDNFATRYLVNDSCFSLSIPYVYAAISNFQGNISVFCTKNGPCYRCLFPDPPPPGTVKNCAEAGVMGVLPGMLGVMQANEAMKWILGIGDVLVSKFLTVNALSMDIKKFTFQRSLHCKLCSSEMRVEKSAPSIQLCTNALTGSENTVNVEQFADLLSKDDVSVIDVREPHEYDYFHMDAELIPFSDIENAYLEKLNSKKVIVICHSGVRSQKAVDIIRSKVSNAEVYSLRGGLLAWVRYQIVSF